MVFIVHIDLTFPLVYCVLIVNSLLMYSYSIHFFLFFQLLHIPNLINHLPLLNLMHLSNKVCLSLSIFNSLLGSLLLLGQFSKPSLYLFLVVGHHF